MLPGSQPANHIIVRHALVVETGRSRLRTETRKFNAAVEAGDKEAAEAQLRVASRKLDKAVTKGVFHRNSAANKKSNMARALNKMD